MCLCVWYTCVCVCGIHVSLCVCVCVSVCVYSIVVYKCCTLSHVPSRMLAEAVCVPVWCCVCTCSYNLTHLFPHLSGLQTGELSTISPHCVQYTITTCTCVHFSPYQWLIWSWRSLLMGRSRWGLARSGALWTKAAVAMVSAVHVHMHSLSGGSWYTCNGLSLYLQAAGMLSRSPAPTLRSAGIHILCRLEETLTRSYGWMLSGKWCQSSRALPRPQCDLTAGSVLF